MKNIIYIFLAAVLILHACNTDKQKDTGHNKDTSGYNKTHSEMQQDFPVIENLPNGIDTVFGKAPSKEKGFFKFSFPRSDLKVTNDGISLDARLSFTTWFSF